MSNIELICFVSVIFYSQSFFLGFGVIMFAFGGAGIFPTIQNDMSSRDRFPLAVALAFAGKN
jgi:amino acid permease